MEIKMDIYLVLLKDYCDHNCPEWSEAADEGRQGRSVPGGTPVHSRRLQGSFS